DFGYFTLSDNHYENNTRSSNQFVADITAEALYAEKVGMHSAWIGEHHFNSLGVLSCPDMVLAYVAANTTWLRLAPAVNVLPPHLCCGSSAVRCRTSGLSRLCRGRPRPRQGHTSALHGYLGAKRRNLRRSMGAATTTEEG